MRASAAKKAVSLTLSLVYFTTQIALGNQPESNFWQERRKTHRPVEVAALPAAFPLSSRMNAALDFPVIPAKAGIQALNQKSETWTPAFAGVTNSRLRILAETIPQTHATIQEIQDSGDDKQPPVVLVQDVHMNNEAQTNIAAVLQALINKHQVNAIGVEGAFADFDVNVFREIKDQKAVRAAAQEFFDKNKLAAPSYVGLFAEQAPRFIGIDDQTHYDANVQAYLDSRLLKEKALADLNKAERAYTSESVKVFSPGLKRFSGARSAYAKGSLGLGAYARALAKLSEPHGTLAQFLNAYEMEQSLDFGRVEAERKTVLEQLARTITESEATQLVEMSIAYRTGRLGFGAYYANLKNLLDRHGVTLSNTPAFATYVRYVVQADGINADELFTSIEKTEAAIASKLARTPNEKELLAHGEHLLLTGKLLEFSLTPKEWEKYKNPTPGPSPTGRGTGWGGLAPFETFYHEADTRSRKMIEKVLPGSALVVGGFHTPHLTQLLRDRKIPYVVVSPKITKIDAASGNAYLSVFAREKTPLEKLLAGEKLFLAPQNNLSVQGTRIGVLAETAIQTDNFPSKIQAAVAIVKDLVTPDAKPVEEGLQLWSNEINSIADRLVAGDKAGDALTALNDRIKASINNRDAMAALKEVHDKLGLAGNVSMLTVMTSFAIATLSNPESITNQDLENIETALQKIGPLKRDAGNPKLPTSAFTVPVLFNFALSPVISNDAEFIRLSSNIKKLPGTFGVRTVALGLFLMELHVHHGVNEADFADFQGLGDELPFLLETISDPAVPKVHSEAMRRRLLRLLLEIAPFNETNKKLWDKTIVREGDKYPTILSSDYIEARRRFMEGFTVADGSGRRIHPGISLLLQTARDEIKSGKFRLQQWDPQKYRFLFLFLQNVDPETPLPEMGLESDETILSLLGAKDAPVEDTLAKLDALEAAIAALVLRPETRNGKPAEEDEHSALIATLPHKELKLSIVVPVYREFFNGNIFRMLESLADQTGAKSKIFEVILVVNNSPLVAVQKDEAFADNQALLRMIAAYNEGETKEALAMIPEAYRPMMAKVFKKKIVVHAIDKSTAGMPKIIGRIKRIGGMEADHRLRQVGFEQGFIANLDADTTVSPNYVAELIRISEQDNVEAVFLDMEYVYRGDDKKAFSSHHRFHLGSRNNMFLKGTLKSRVNFAGGPQIVVRARTYRKLSLFADYERDEDRMMVQDIPTDAPTAQISHVKVFTSDRVRPENEGFVSSERKKFMNNYETSNLQLFLDSTDHKVTDPYSPSQIAYLFMKIELDRALKKSQSVQESRQMLANIMVAHGFKVDTEWLETGMLPGGKLVLPPASYLMGRMEPKTYKQNFLEFIERFMEDFTKDTDDLRSHLRSGEKRDKENLDRLLTSVKKASFSSNAEARKILWNAGLPSADWFIEEIQNSTLEQLAAVYPDWFAPLDQAPNRENLLYASVLDEFIQYHKHHASPFHNFLETTFGETMPVLSQPPASRSRGALRALRGILLKLSGYLPSGPPAAIVAPFFQRWATPGTWKFWVFYVPLIAVISPLWETAAFQMGLTPLLGLEGMALSFALTHLVVRWIARAIWGTPEGETLARDILVDFPILMLLGMIFGLPFVDVPSAYGIPSFISNNAFLSAFIAHAVYNALIIFTPLKNYLPAGSVLGGDVAGVRQSGFKKYTVEALTKPAVRDNLPLLFDVLRLFPTAIRDMSDEQALNALISDIAGVAEEGAAPSMSMAEIEFDARQMVDFVHKLGPARETKRVYLGTDVQYWDLIDRVLHGKKSNLGYFFLTRVSLLDAEELSFDLHPTNGIAYTIMASLISSAGKIGRFARTPEERDRLFNETLSNFFDNEMREGEFQKQLLKKFQESATELSPAEKRQIGLLKNRNVFKTVVEKIYRDFEAQFPDDQPLQIAEAADIGVQPFLLQQAARYFGNRNNISVVLWGPENSRIYGQGLFPWVIHRSKNVKGFIDTFKWIGSYRVAQKAMNGNGFLIRLASQRLFAALLTFKCLEQATLIRDAKQSDPAPLSPTQIKINAIKEMAPAVPIFDSEATFVQTLKNGRPEDVPLLLDADMETATTQAIKWITHFGGTDENWLRNKRLILTAPNPAVFDFMKRFKNLLGIDKSNLELMLRKDTDTALDVIYAFPNKIPDNITTVRFLVPNTTGLPGNFFDFSSAGPELRGLIIVNLLLNELGGVMEFKGSLLSDIETVRKALVAA